MIELLQLIADGRDGTASQRFGPYVALGMFGQVEPPQRYLDERGTLLDVGSSMSNG